MSFGPIVPSTGPYNARIMFLAEAPGSEESAKGVPLVGPSGHELRRMCSTIGVSLDDCYKANVFSRQPPANALAVYGVERSDPRAVAERGPLTVNPITFLNREHQGDVDRALAEIAAVNPNVLVALGNTATWALGLGQGIAALRGSVHTVNIPGMDRPLKVLPTYHPAAILRQWDLRVIAMTDLAKALTQSTFPEFNFDDTELWINPSLDDLDTFDRVHMEPARICAADIETKRGQITCISFAPSVDVSLAIPFWVEGQCPNYWADGGSEARAWSYVRKWMERADLVKVFQNGLYDLQYLQAHCTPRACTEDTMLMSHSLWSELPKGLGFLGATFAHTPSWKSMRTAKREDLLKRDD